MARGRDFIEAAWLIIVYLLILAFLIVLLLLAYYPAPALPPTGDTFAHNTAAEWTMADRFIARWQPDPAIRREILSETWQATGSVDRFYLLLAQQAAESGFDPEASNGEDYGIAQINHRNLAAWGVTDWRSIRQNIGAQASYMGDLMARGGTRRAVAAYNAGWRGTSRRIPASTAAYAERVMGYWRELSDRRDAQ